MSEVSHEALMTPSEVAEYFGVGPKTVTRWDRAGELSAVRTLGGHRRYSQREVHALREVESSGRME
jgi:excisionase family DNA binding protein